MHGFDVSDREMNPMWNIMRLKERQDCIEMFMVRPAHDFPVLKAVHTEIWGAQIVTKPHTLKSSVRQASCIGNKGMCTRQMTGDIRPKNMEILGQIMLDFVGGMNAKMFLIDQDHFCQLLHSLYSSPKPRSSLFSPSH